MHRITEAEERTSELEGRMMEIAAMESKKMRTVLETSVTVLNAPILTL